MSEETDGTDGKPLFSASGLDGPPRLVASIEAYAELNASLASGRDPDAVLAEHGLTEPEWECADAYWQSALSDAMDRHEDGVPPLVEQYAQRLAEARGRGRDLSVEPMSLEDFGKATGAIRRRGDPRAALAEVGIELTTYMQASSFWTSRMARDRTLSDRFLHAQGDSGALTDVTGVETLADELRSQAKNSRSGSGGTDK